MCLGWPWPDQGLMARGLALNGDSSGLLGSRGLSLGAWASGSGYGALARGWAMCLRFGSWCLGLCGVVVLRVVSSCVVIWGLGPFGPAPGGLGGGPGLELTLPPWGSVFWSVAGSREGVPVPGDAPRCYGLRGVRVGEASSPGPLAVASVNVTTLKADTWKLLRFTHWGRDLLAIQESRLCRGSLEYAQALKLAKDGGCTLARGPVNEAGVCLVAFAVKRRHLVVDQEAGTGPVPVPSRRSGILGTGGPARS